MKIIINFLIENKAYIAMSIPMWTRAYYALKTGGGLVGIWRSIMFGTNTPKQTETKYK
jgi:hypothetical protein